MSQNRLLWVRFYGSNKGETLAQLGQGPYLFDEVNLLQKNLREKTLVHAIHVYIYFLPNESYRTKTGY